MRRIKILLFCIHLFQSIFGEDAVNEAVDEDKYFIEDFSKVDLSSLEIVKREIVPVLVAGVECEHLQEEIFTYRYEALTKSGTREEIFLKDRKQMPAIKKITHTTFTDSEDPDYDHELIYFPYLDCLEMDHPDLINEVKSMIDPPSKEEYNFTNLQKNFHGYVDHPGDVDRIVYGGQLKNGFFIEAGSVDAETLSDTLYFEIKHNWTGILVEAMPATYHAGLKKHRKTYGIQTCLSTENRTKLLDFDPISALRDSDGNGESMGGIVNTTGQDTFKIQCMPLYSILLALGNPTVHWMSLDIEGAEFPVLKSIPWDKVDIQALTVETHFFGRYFPGDRDEFLEYMKSVGYTHIENAHKDTWNLEGYEFQNRDDLFVRNDVPLASQRLKSLEGTLEEPLDSDRLKLDEIIKDIPMPDDSLHIAKQEL